MSHLGDRLSALVDGEISHDERDRMHVHLAACAQCRREAAALRALKRRVATLGEAAAMDPRLLGRLFAIADAARPAANRPRRSPGARHPVFPITRQRGAAAPLPGRVRNLVAAAAACLVIVIGSLSFYAGGTPRQPGPHVTPPVEMFTVEHTVTTGDMTLVNPVATVLPAQRPGTGQP